MRTQTIIFTVYLMIVKLLKSGERIRDAVYKKTMTGNILNVLLFVVIKTRFLPKRSSKINEIVST